MMKRSFFGESVLYAALVSAGPGAATLKASDFVVQGSYAVHATIGPGLGSSLGIFNVDKSGTLNGYALLNLPSEDGKSRRLVRLAVTGTVTVNADGTGQAKYGGPLPDGTTPPPYTEDFVITKARKSGHGKLALKIVDQRQEASILLGMGNAVTVTWSRLPDDTPEN